MDITPLKDVSLAQLKAEIERRESRMNWPSQLIELVKATGGSVDELSTKLNAGLDPRAKIPNALIRASLTTMVELKVVYMEEDKFKFKLDIPAEDKSIRVEKRRAIGTFLNPAIPVRVEHSIKHALRIFLADMTKTYTTKELQKAIEEVLRIKPSKSFAANFSTNYFDRGILGKSGRGKFFLNSLNPTIMEWAKKQSLKVDLRKQL